MNIWMTLGIEPTTDKKKIKLAYSIKLKAINHETQVLEFQELRQAYEMALGFAGIFAEAGFPVFADSSAAQESNDSGSQEPQTIGNDDAVQPQGNLLQEYDDEELFEEQNPTFRTAFAKEVDLSANAFMERCRSLYHSDYRTRYTGNEWSELVADEKFEWLKFNKQLSGDVFSFVTEHTDFAPGILSILNGFFAWTNDEMYWASRVPNRDFNIFLLKIRKGLFSFEHFDFKAKVDFDRYFKMREELYDRHLAYMLVRNDDNFRALEQLLKDLRKIYAGDRGLKSIRKLVWYSSLATFFWVDKERAKPVVFSPEDWVLFIFLIIPCAWPFVFIVVVIRLVKFSMAALYKSIKDRRDKCINICSFY